MVLGMQLASFKGPEMGQSLSYTWKEKTKPFIDFHLWSKSNSLTWCNHCVQVSLAWGLNGHISFNDQL